MVPSCCGIYGHVGEPGWGKTGQERELTPHFGKSLGKSWAATIVVPITARNRLAFIVLAWID